MSKHREKRQLAKKCVVYCEGQTELNYVRGLKRWLKSVEPSLDIMLDPTDVKGGGYSVMLDKIRTAPDSNCIARIVLIDFDRYKKHAGERPVLRSILAVSRASIRKNVPVVVIVSNESFEYVICCHDEKYNDADPATFLCREWGYRSLNECKSDDRIWEKCCKGSRSIHVALELLRGKPSIVRNEMAFREGKPFPFELSKVTFDESLEACRCSNFADLALVAGIK
ncbi:MAG: RloB domain-containing protein [Eggerthellaceae bacterium]|nr:RloB domain-containing protein [Eggerthellaceae bacterium]